MKEPKPKTKDFKALNWNNSLYSDQKGNVETFDKVWKEKKKYWR